MVNKKAPAGKKLKVKKDTIKDLDVKGKGSRVKGGGLCTMSAGRQVKITR